MNITLIENIAEIVKILSATFLGASIAFYFNRQNSRVEEEDRNYTACLKMQAIFYQYHESIYNIKNQFLDGFENDGNRAFKIKHISFCEKFSSFKMGELAFILRTKKPDLLNIITNTYKNCVSAMDSVRERNEQYKKTISVLKLLDDGCFDVPKVESIFLKDFTDSMYKQFASTLIKINETDEELKVFIKGNFKGRHALQVEMIREDKNM